ncbi:hypothetical protein MSG28_005197 [Choristoneura fumiferana]|uniref:Uncharacterized protein n=1 Tax=Choristoneura fumiferana TaxID=7141 RepID=A0ACC0JQI9_CHOFU|nr:hypothetical protein MSG28_005197 [Choristoneura fumiferana]
MEKPEKNEITYEYTRKRKYFGRQCLFEDHGPEVLINIANNPVFYKNYILRNPVHVAIQNTGTMSEHWVNSVRAEYTSSGIRHVEGGWPKDINMNDPEATQRYRRKIEKDDAYMHAVMHLGHSMEHNILQNQAIDMYQTYYEELPSIPPVERSSCHTVNVYREPGTRRPVRSLSWQADGGARLATAYADVDLSRNNRAQQVSYIWDIENANAPELTIKPTQPLLDLQYNPRDQNILVGGMLNGQGLLVACGSSKGTVYLAELSQNLGTADKNDKQLLTHILDRENKRERILEARMREMRLRMRQDRDGAQQNTETDHTANDRDLEEATTEYMQTISELQAQQKMS